MVLLSHVSQKTFYSTYRTYVFWYGDVSSWYRVLIIEGRSGNVVGNVLDSTVLVPVDMRLSVPRKFHIYSLPVGYNRVQPSYPERIFFMTCPPHLSLSFLREFFHVYWYNCTGASYN